MGKNFFRTDRDFLIFLQKTFEFLQQFHLRARPSLIHERKVDFELSGNISRASGYFALFFVMYFIYDYLSIL
jgi:hypothetical protein